VKKLPLSDVPKEEQRSPPAGEFTAAIKTSGAFSFS
jgi:hypothetical protein